MVKNDVLGKLFGSPVRVKMMRLFLFNPELGYDIEEISKQTKVSSATAKKEVKFLQNIGLIKPTVFSMEVEKGGSSNTKWVKQKFKGWTLDQDFHYLSGLQNLLIKIPPFSPREIENRFKSSGNIKLLLVSGVFIQEWDTAVDILIVGDGLNNRFVDSAVRSLEEEIGRELTYAVFDTGEFEYRVNIYDKLVRDILDFPHEKIVNRLGI